MSESALGLLLLAAICAVCSVAAHVLVRSFVAAELAAVVSTVVLFQLAAYLHVGYLDPFWEVAVVTSTLVAVVVSAFIGIAVRSVQERASREKWFSQ